MALTVTNNGDGTSTATFTYTADTTRLNDTLTDAAKYWHDLTGSGDWGSLTNTQKRAILDVAVRKAVIEWAKIEHTEQAVDSARATADAENETRYI